VQDSKSSQSRAPWELQLSQVEVILPRAFSFTKRFWFAVGARNQKMKVNRKIIL
jgi:hypothetical protein